MKLPDGGGIRTPLSKAHVICLLEKEDGRNQKSKSVVAGGQDSASIAILWNTFSSVALV